MPSDHDLSEIRAFVFGEGRFKFLGPGLTSHPQHKNDANQQRIHRAMLILEQRGEIRRHHVSESGSVVWVPNKQL